MDSNNYQFYEISNDKNGDALYLTSIKENHDVENRECFTLILEQLVYQSWNLFKPKDD